MMYVIVTELDGTSRYYRASKGFIFIHDSHSRLVIFDFPFDISIDFEDIYSFTIELKED